MATSVKDKIYAEKKDKVEDFVFDEKVVNVFEDMIRRSVPGYAAVNQLLSSVATQFVTANTNVYDLGCSLGEASLCLANSICQDRVEIYAVDSSQPMIEKLVTKLANLNISNIHPVQDDVLEIEIKNTSFVVLNYTLQFIQRSKRKEFINKIHTGLIERGALFISEKISYEDKTEDKLMQDLHENFKREHEYSDLEISQKREALENVLVRDTHGEHLIRLKEAGFSSVSALCKYLNFVTYLAVK